MSGRVIVLCKLPHGLTIELPGQPPVTLFGANAERRGGRSVNGFGITENVDADFFEAWLSTHREYAPVKQHLLFSQGKMQDANAEAKEKKDVPSGFERMDPLKPGKDLAPDGDSKQKFSNAMSGGQADQPQAT